MLAPFLIALSLIGAPVMDRLTTDRLTTDWPRPAIAPATLMEVEPAAVEAAEAPVPDMTPSDLTAGDLTPADQPVLPEVPAPETFAGISVDLECLAYPDGYVANCVVVTETRPGLGFGEAAVALMNDARFDPRLHTHRSGPVKFRHTIEFTPD